MGKHSEGDMEPIALLLRAEAASHIWAITPELIGAITRWGGVELTEETLLKLEEAREARAKATPPQQGGVATLSLQGMLMPRASLMSILFGDGGSGLLGFRDQLGAAAADPQVNAIAINVDSPGGYVDLIPEVAADIRSARAKKPVVAVANTMAGSAAYWLASQSSELVVTPSGEVGSVGVYQIHQDQSERMAMMGVNPTIIKAGKYKIEGNPYQPLSEEAQAAMQSDVNDYYDMFTADVARGRNTTKDEVQSAYGEGRMLLARKAVKAGMADRVDTYNNTLRRLTHPGALAALRKADADDDNFQAQLLADAETFAGGDLPPAELELAPVAYSAEDKDRLLDTLARLR